MEVKLFNYNGTLFYYTVLGKAMVVTVEAVRVVAAMSDGVERGKRVRPQAE